MYNYYQSSFTSGLSTIARRSHSECGLSPGASTGPEAHLFGVPYALAILSGRMRQFTAQMANGASRSGNGRAMGTMCSMPGLLSLRSAAANFYRIIASRRDCPRVVGAIPSDAHEATYLPAGTWKLMRLAARCLDADDVRPCGLRGSPSLYVSHILQRVVVVTYVLGGRGTTSCLRGVQ